MADQQIPCGNPGLPLGLRGIGATRLRHFVPGSAERVLNSRRNGPVRYHFDRFAGARARSGRMSATVPHIPVLGREAVEALHVRDGGVYVDATFGAGGYSRMILATPGTKVIGIDRDRTAIAGGFDLVDQSGGRLTLVEDRFSNLAPVCAAPGFYSLHGV